LNNENIEFHIVFGIENKILPYYFNAADVLLLTSLWEGSPNVVKEAMACNLPIVSTDVGDVRELMGGTAGCYITNFHASDVAKKLRLALEFGKRTDGRKKVRHLDTIQIAEKISKIYHQVLTNNRKTA
jgi:glycosyltransferase involved in cell wall biosynthesis